MNLQEELKALKERIAELEEQVEKEGGKEFPQDGDNYWYINPLGIIMRDKWLGFVSEGYMTEIGNVFQTEQQAEFTVEKLKVEAELRKFSRHFKDNDNNYFMKIDSIYNTIVVYDEECHQTQGVIYFESEKKAEEAIESVGEERIKKYIFRVEE